MDRHGSRHLHPFKPPTVVRSAERKAKAAAAEAEARETELKADITDLHGRLRDSRAETERVRACAGRTCGVVALFDGRQPLVPFKQNYPIVFPFDLRKQMQPGIVASGTPPIGTG